MKPLIMILSFILFSTFSSYADQSASCENIKKLSPKYLICMTKSAGTAIKNKLSKNNKKFKDAKTLSDLKN